MLPLPPPQGGQPWGPEGAPCDPLTLPLRQELPRPPGKLYKTKRNHIFGTKSYFKFRLTLVDVIVDTFL